MKKKLILFIKNLDAFLTAASCKLVVITGKSKYPIHPKHLIKQQIWFKKYLKNDDLILDLGCGTGTQTKLTAKKVKMAIGLDFDPDLLQIAQKTAENENIKNIKFIQFDLNKKLNFIDGYFDKIICSDVLEHLNRRDFALNEIKRVLKKNGLLLLVTDNPNNSWKKLQKSAGVFYYADSDHKYEYPKEEIISKLDQVGFKIINLSTVTYETPFKGLIDFTGGFSLTAYRKLRNWREKMNQKNPEETVGFRIVAQSNF